MHDKIVIEGLSAMTTIGVYDWEQSIKQRLVLDLIIDWNNQSAGKSDNINDCLDYEKVSQAIIDFLTPRQFLLIERVAEEVAALVITLFSVPKIKVKVSKPSALTVASNVAVVIERRVPLPK